MEIGLRSHSAWNILLAVDMTSDYELIELLRVETRNFVSQTPPANFPLQTVRIAAGRMVTVMVEISERLLLVAFENLMPNPEYPLLLLPDSPNLIHNRGSGNL